MKVRQRCRASGHQSSAWWDCFCCIFVLNVAWQLLGLCLQDEVACWAQVITWSFQRWSLNHFGPTGAVTALRGLQAVAVPICRPSCLHFGCKGSDALAAVVLGRLGHTCSTAFPPLVMVARLASGCATVLHGMYGLWLEMSISSLLAPVCIIAYRWQPSDEQLPAGCSSASAWLSWL